MATVKIPNDIELPYDALVDPGGGGDYTTPGAACAGEATNAIIAMVPGTYDDSAAGITMKDGQVLATISRPSGGVAADWPVIIDIGANDFIAGNGSTVRGVCIRFEGQGSAAYSFTAANTCSFLDVRFQHTGTTQGRLFDSSGAHTLFRDCYLDGNGYVVYGFDITGDYTVFRNIVMENMALRNYSSGEGINFSGAHGCIVDGMYLNEVGTGVHASNYAIYESGSGGPEGNYYKDIYIYDNAFKLNGIYLAYDGSVVEGAYIEGGREGIYLAGATDCRINDYHVKNAVRSGLRLTASSDRAKISNVTIDNCGHATDSSSNGMDIVSDNYKISNVDIINPPGGSSYAIRVWNPGEFVNCNIAGVSYLRVYDAYFSNVIFASISFYDARRNRFSNCKYTSIAATGGTIEYNKFDNTYDPGADTDPTVNEDVNDGFEEGDRWINPVTKDIFICLDNSAGAADWDQLATGAPVPELYDALVDAGGGGDYTEINAACTGEAAYAIIAVAPGTYTESAAITPKDGQEIIALGGISGSVTVQMGANIVNLNGVDDVSIRNLRFEWAWNIAADYVFKIQGLCTGCVIEHIYLDLSGCTSNHYGIYDDSTYNLMRDITIYGDEVYTLQPLQLNACYESLYERFVILNFNHKTDDGVKLDTCGQVTLRDFEVRPLYGDSDYFLINETGSDNYSNSILSCLLYGAQDGGAPSTTASSGLRLAGYQSVADVIHVSACEVGLVFDQSETWCTNFEMYNTQFAGNAIEFRSGSGSVLSNVILDSIDGNAIVGIAATDACLSNIAMSGTAANDLDLTDASNPSGWKITNMLTGSAVSVTADDTTFTNCTFGAAVTVNSGADSVKFAACTFSSTFTLSGYGHATNCTFVGAATVSADEMSQFGSCTFESAVTVSSSNAYFSNCRFEAASSNWDAANMHFSNCLFTGNQTFGSSSDSCVFVGCYFSNDLTFSAGANNNELVQCYISGALSDSGTNNHFNIACSGEMQDADNGTADTIDAASSWHSLYRQLSTTATRSMGTNTGLRRTITAAATAAAGAKTKFTTSVAHGLSVGDPVSITGTTNYDGLYLVDIVDDATNFTVVVAFVANDSGAMIRAAALQASNKQGAGRYQVNVSISAAVAATNKDFDFAVIQNATVVDKIKARRQFGTTDIGSISLSGILEVAVDDWISVAMQNVTDATNVTIRNINISMHKID